MAGEIVTLGKEIKPISGKLPNEIIELEEGPNAYTIKIGNGRTLFIYNQFCIGKKPEVGDLVCDYCEICGSYKFSDLFSTRCHYESQYVCTPNVMTCFKKKTVKEKKEINIQPKIEQATELENINTDIIQTRKPNLFEKILNKLKLNKTK